MGNSRGIGFKEAALAVTITIVLVVGGAMALAVSKAASPFFSVRTAYASELTAASTWSDAFNKKVDALPAANKMTLEQAKTARKLMLEMTNRFKNTDSMTEEQNAELKAVGSARLQKLTDGAKRIVPLMKQAETNRCKSFKKYQVKGVKVVAKKGKAVISWTKNKNATLGYEVYMSAEKNKGFKKVEDTIAANKVKVTVDDLAKGKRYYFKVRALTSNTNTAKIVYSKYSKAMRSAAIK